MTESQTKNSITRPPIVVVMGHVDHGKTTLLDFIRKANIAAKEAGGITQSIGAYEIVHNDKRITFIDTPGHEAFSKMRSRGANIADLAILVVAADEGLKPQTKESIKTLEETKTPFIVAITKTDKTGADIEKVKNDLTSANVLLEGYGGNVSYEPVSAKDGKGIDELLDLILLTAEVENLTYEPDSPATGFVLETKVDKQRGLEATVIVKNGTLHQGETIATETVSGRIKILENFLEKTIKELVPSAPALIIGFEKLPQVGEEFLAGDDAKSRINTNLTKTITNLRETNLQISDYSRERNSGLDSRSTLNLILKAGDAGSLEALTEVIKATPNEKPVRIVSGSVGEIIDNDIKFAISSQSLIIGFKSKVDKTAKNLAEVNKIKIITSEIIYDLLKAIKDFLIETGKPKSLGELEVLAIFNQPKPERQLVGGKVTHGLLRNKSILEIKRNDSSIDSGQDATVGTGRILNLQQGKKDTHEVTENNECGLLVNASVMIKVGDHLVIRSNE
jgi:translation initiation factor IF-2